MFRWFMDLKLVYKLLIPVAFLVVTIGGILWSAQSGIVQLRRDTAAMLDQTVRRRVLFVAIMADLNDAAIQEKIIVGSTDAAARKTSGIRFTARFAKALDATDQIIPLTPSEQRASAQGFRSLLLDYKQAADRSIASSLRDETYAARQISFGEVIDVRRKIAASAEEGEEATVMQMQERQAALGALNDTVLLRLYVLAGTGLALAIGLLAVVVTVFIVRPLSAVTGSMQRLAAGDLDLEVSFAGRRDEVGALAQALQVFKDNGRKVVALQAEVAVAQAAADAERSRTEAEQQRAAVWGQIAIKALGQGLGALADGNLTHQITVEVAPLAQQLKDNFNVAANRLRETMTTIAGAIEGMTNGAGEISQAADDLSRRTEQQAASLEQTAAALDQITATVRKTAEGANHVQAAVSSAKQDAEHSSAVVRDAVLAMGEIEASSQQVGQIIGVIDEIAFQTNLLALNAGVEAARAGDAGRGFAVVASEVRALAQRSAQAAKEIKQLIATSSKQVGRGVKLVDETGQSLQRIAGHVAAVHAAVTEIAASAKEQATGLREVNAAVNQMDQVTQQNAAMVEQSTAASHALVQETAELSRLTGYFQVGTRPAAVQADVRPVRPSRPMAPKAVARGGGRSPALAETDGWQDF